MALTNTSGFEPEDGPATRRRLARMLRLGLAFGALVVLAATVIATLITDDRFFA